MVDHGSVSYEWRGDVTDDELAALHAQAFDHAMTTESWAARLDHHSLGWMTARLEAHLVGFVNVAWDGGRHAFLLDTVVRPDLQRVGIGGELVRAAAEATRAAGCEWLHVDFESRLRAFYIESCRFQASDAGVMALAGRGSETPEPLV